MKHLITILILLTICAKCQSEIYEESIREMMFQCNIYQHEVSKENRPKHLCKKEDDDDDFSYYITTLESKFSHIFTCELLCQRGEFNKNLLNFYLSFYYFQFGVVYNKPVGDRWESSINFKVSSIVVVPHAGSEMPQIFGFELNKIDKCPFCGKRLQSIGLILQGRVTTQARWPWHAALFYQEGFSLAYKCGGSIIREVCKQALVMFSP